MESEEGREKAAPAESDSGRQEAAQEDPVRRKKKKKKKRPLLWAFQIFVLTFFLSLSFSVLSQLVAQHAHLVVALILLAVIIGISIVTDIIGVAAASCSVEPFLAMAARRKKGARMAVRIAKNAEKVSNLCADVIGDICGIISGALGAAIVGSICLLAPSWDEFLLSVLFSAVIAACTVGGKALGKKFAMSNSQNIIYTVAKVLSVFSKR